MVAGLPKNGEDMIGDSILGSLFLIEAKPPLIKNRGILDGICIFFLRYSNRCIVLYD